MARIVVENFKRASSTETELHIEAVIHHGPDSILRAIQRYLGAAQALWPDAVVLKDVFIIDLRKK